MAEMSFTGTTPAHTYARETGTMYGNNQAADRATRRLRAVLETARNFAFSLAADEKRQPSARDKSTSIRDESTSSLLQSGQRGRRCDCVAANSVRLQQLSSGLSPRKAALSCSRSASNPETALAQPEWASAT
jgi:hypothetical protein